MPTLPEVFPHVPTHPAFQGVNFPADFAETEVIPPAANSRLPVAETFVQGDAASRVPVLPHRILQAFKAALGRGDPEPEELAVPRSAGTTLDRVDPQSQVLGDPGRETFQNPFTAPLASDENRHIVRVTTEIDAPPLQFLVKNIQVDVGQ